MCHWVSPPHIGSPHHYLHSLLKTAISEIYITHSMNTCQCQTELIMGFVYWNINIYLVMSYIPHGSLLVMYMWTCTLHHPFRRNKKQNILIFRDRMCKPCSYIWWPFYPMFWHSSQIVSKNCTFPPPSLYQIDFSMMPLPYCLLHLNVSLNRILFGVQGYR